MGEYMVAVVWIWTTTAQNITERSKIKSHSKATGQQPPFCFCVCVCVCVCVCLCVWGRVCVTWHWQLLWHPQLCSLHLHNLASQGCNKRKKWDDGKEGWMGGWGFGGWGMGVPGGYWGGHWGWRLQWPRGLLWADSWKQTHVTQKSAPVFLDSLVSLLWLLF